MKMTTRHGIIGISLVILLALFAFPIATSAAELRTKGCNGNQICDVISNCDASGCSTSYDNCESCGVNVKACGSGIVTSPNVCVDSGGAPSCVKTTPICNSPGSADPNVVLTYSGFSKKNLFANVTPSTQTGLAGSTLNYKITVENKNPVTLQLGLGSQIPNDWSINMPEETSIPQKGTKDIVVRVTSNETASDGDYPVIFVMAAPSLGLFGSVQATYIVGSRGSPSVNTTPRTQKGYPGQSLFYNVSVTNNDPPGFDASTISLRAEAPDGFNPIFTPNSIKLGAGQSGNVRLDIASPANATQSKYQLVINATINRLSGLDFIEYEIDFCGNNVCDLGEEGGSCPSDCPAESFIICNGRCEQELDDGMDFSAYVNVPFTKFIICSRNTTLTACNNAARTINGCGLGKACLCTDNTAGCGLRCVDEKGAYYLVVNGTGGGVVSNANYSFACPFVDMPEINMIKTDFTNAKQDYEKAQSALREVLKAKNITVEEKAAQQPCLDALGSILYDVNDYLSFLNRVIAWPGKMNTTAARERADMLRDDIDATYNSFCGGASGLLQIQSISASTFEKNTTGNVQVILENIGSITYFGYASCDLTGGNGEKTTVNSSCDIINGQGSLPFSLPVFASSSGTWATRCKAFGSLNPDCSAAAIHDDKSGNFSVFTRETFVVDVAGACGLDGINCSVRTSRGGCGACSINGVACAKTDTVNNTDFFKCPIQPSGTYTLVGSVLSNNQCKPVAPVEKNTSVRCAGCGDGIVDSPEVCELPFTDNNAKCVQTETTCQGKLFASRDKLGFCTAGCGCAYDEYDLSCTAGKCGAECEDGETRTVIINGTGGASCSCVQQCGSSCGWNACSCEPTVPAPTTPPNVTVIHSPSSPAQTTPVTLLATGSGATNAEIYVDGFIVKSCSTLPCSLTANFDPGVHAYFARATNALGTDTDPDSGSKTFIIPGATNGTGGTGLNTTTVILDVSASPDGAGVNEEVLLTAIAHGPKSFKQVNIFVDGALKKSCTNYPQSQPCTYRSAFASGAHEYHSTAVDVSNNFARDPVSGFKEFSVAGATSGGGGGSGGIGPQPQGNISQPPGRCYAKIEEKSCTYNAVTRRYDVSISAAWDNGTHAHWDIEDNQGPKIYTEMFNHTEQQAGPGLKSIKVQVHNVNDTTLCQVSDTIYCGPGTTTGKDVDVIIDVKNVVKTGATDVRLIAVPYKDIDVFRLESRTETGIDIQVLKVEGNTTIAGVSGPNRIFENKTYDVYTLATELKAGKNISMIYRMTADKEGEYSLVAVANYSGKTVRFTKILKVTNCPNTNSVLAKQGDACKAFSTSCDVPPGWAPVESCSQESLAPISNDQTPLVAGIALLIIVIISGVGYKYRDKIKEKIDELRSRFSHKEENMTIEFDE